MVVEEQGGAMQKKKCLGRAMEGLRGKARK